MEKEKSCPKCGGSMTRIWSGSELPSVPFVRIPGWARKIAAYACGDCGYVELWKEEP